ncbi:MAG: hypothetical protein GEV03_26845 [Streptosporangiales bacterium]|nr:hypothetical protein [Streptosporangiales bacterium]
MTKRASPPRPRTHDPRCAERIRVLKLAEAGDPPRPPAELLHTISAEIKTHCAHAPLKAYRLAYGWTVTGAVRALHAMCDEHGLGRSGLTKRSWLDWEAGNRPSRYNQDLLCRLFGTGPVQLGFARDYGDHGHHGTAEIAVPSPRAALASRDTLPAAGRPEESPAAVWEPPQPHGSLAEGF